MDRSLVLHGAPEVAVLASPVRFAIVEALQSHGPATVASLAARLGRSPDSLYHHLRRLVAAGVLAREGVARGAGRSAAVYAATRRLSAHLGPGSDPASRAAWAEVARALLRRTELEVRAAAGAAGTRTSGPERDLALVRRKLRLDARGLRELNRLLDEVERRLAEIPPGTAGPRPGRLFHLTFALVPLELPSEES